MMPFRLRKENIDTSHTQATRKRRHGVEAEFTNRRHIRPRSIQSHGVC